MIRGVLVQPPGTCTVPFGICNSLIWEISCFERRFRRNRVAKFKTSKKLARTGKYRAHVATGQAHWVYFTRFIAKDTPAAVKIDAIRTGINAGVVDEMVGYFDMSKSEIFDILLTPASTAHRLIKEKRPLDPAASERVVRVADVTRMAEETFGGREAAARWLKTPNLALRNATPLSMLDTEPGAGEVRRVLAAINYGGAL
jgi:putative toxin-antitoxin system antitoxin component (TIGR02293 family)